MISLFYSSFAEVFLWRVVLKKMLSGTVSVASKQYKPPPPPEIQALPEIEPPPEGRSKL